MEGCVDVMGQETRIEVLRVLVDGVTLKRRGFILPRIIFNNVYNSFVHGEFACL